MVHESNRRVVVDDENIASQKIIAARTGSPGRRVRKASISLAVVTMLVLVSAAVMISPSSNSAIQEKATAKTTVDEHVRVGWRQDFQNWNPMTIEFVSDWVACYLMYSSLFQYDEDWNRIEMMLATDYYQVVDQTGAMSTFINISQNAYFRNAAVPDDTSHPVTAEDVKFTIELIQNNPGGSWDHYVYGISDVHVVNDYQVQIDTEYSKATLIDDLVWIPILPKFWWEPVDAMGRTLANKNPSDLIGSGPFIFNSMSLGQWYKFDAAPNFHGSADYGEEKDIDFGGIIYTVYADILSLALAMEYGQEDVVDLTGVHGDVWDNLGENNPEITKQVTVELGIYDVAINAIPLEMRTLQYGNGNVILLDKEVRKALGMTINRDSLVSQYFDGLPVAADTVLNPGFWHANLTEYTEVLPYNPQWALENLTAAGYEDTDGDGILEVTDATDAYLLYGADIGAPLQFRLRVPDSDPGYAVVGEAWVGWAEDAGIQLDFSVESEGIMVSQDWYKADFDIWVWSWYWGPEPLSNLACWLTSEIIEGGYNCVGPITDDWYWVDEQARLARCSFDDVFDEAMREADKDARKLLVDELQVMIYDAYTEFPPIHPSGLYAWTEARFVGWGDWESHPARTIISDMLWLWFDLEPAEANAPIEGPYVQVGMLSPVMYWNPLNMQMVEDYIVTFLVYSSLVTYDENWEGPVNDLATGYWQEVHANGSMTTYISITNNAYFRGIDNIDDISHPLDARDVAYTYNLIKDNPGGTFDVYLSELSYFTAYQNSTSGKWDQVSTWCPYTKATLMDDISSVPILPMYLWGPDGENYEARALGAMDPSDQIGSGPFVFEDWERDSWYMFKTAPNYHGEADYGPARTVSIPGVLYEVLSDTTAMCIEINSGDLDCGVLTGDYSAFQDVLGKDASVNVYKAAVAENGITDIAINALPDCFDEGTGYLNRHPALLDPFVREAIFMTLNKDYIVNTIMGGLPVTAHSVVQPGFWQADIQNKIVYDPAGAKAMLLANGWADGDGDGWLEATATAYGVQMGWFPVGTELSGIRVQAVDTDANYGKIAVAWPGWAEDAGIQLIGSVETETTMVNKAWYAADYDIWVWHWGWGPEPIGGALSVWLTSEIEKGGDNCQMPMGPWWAHAGNYTTCPYISADMIAEYGIDDPDTWNGRFSAFDQNITDAWRILDVDDRKVILDKLQQWVYDSYCEMPPYYDVGLYGFTDYRFTNWGDWEAHSGLSVASSLPWIWFRLEPAGNHMPVFEIPPFPSYEVEVGAPNTFTLSISDSEGDPVRVNWSTGDGTTYVETVTGDTTIPTTVECTHAYETAGTFTLRVGLKDDYHENETVRTAVVNVVGEINLGPVIENITSHPEGAYIGEEVIWSTEARDFEQGPTGEGLLFTWDWDDGTYTTTLYQPVDNYTLVHDEQTHIWDVAGIYSVKLSVWDGFDEETDPIHNVSVAVYFWVKEPVTTPPLANFTVTPEVGYVGTVFTVDASSSYDMQDPVEVLEVRWDWNNDGVWDTGWTTNKDAVLMILVAGEYILTLEVRDSDGMTDTDSHVVKVFDSSFEQGEFPERLFTIVKPSERQGRAEYVSTMTPQDDFDWWLELTHIDGSWVKVSIYEEEISSTRLLSDSKVAIVGDESEHVVLRAGTVYWIVIQCLGRDGGAGLTEHAVPTAPTLSHDPILIDGDDDFSYENGVVRGDGTYENPYVIDGWMIEADTANGIEIRNTDAHFVIRDVEIVNGLAGYFSGIKLYRTTNGSIDDCGLEDNLYGILVEYSSGLTIIDNRVASCLFGVVVGQSDNVGIHRNEIISCALLGIHVNSTGGFGIMNNSVSDTGDLGISLGFCRYGTIAGNVVVLSDGCGIALRHMNEQISLFKNNMWNNSVQAFDDNVGVNSWYEGYPWGGNFWSDYTGVDMYSGPDQDIPGSDGIGDTPYTIGVFDRYPLMTPVG